MKLQSIYYLSIFSLFFLFSCGSVNQVNNGGLFQKRKYNKGFYWNRNTQIKSNESRDIALQEINIERQSISENIQSTSTLDELESAESVKNQINVSEDHVEVNHSNGMDNDFVSTKTIIFKTKAVEEIKKQSTQRNTTFSNKVLHTKSQQQKTNHSGKSSNDMLIIAVICAILLPPLGVAVHTRINWTKVLIALILTILFYFPGLIYALLVVFDKL